MGIRIREEPLMAALVQTATERGKPPLFVVIEPILRVCGETGRLSERTIRRIELDERILAKRLLHLLKVPVEDFHLLEKLAVGAYGVLIADERVHGLAERHVEQSL